MKFPSRLSGPIWSLFRAVFGLLFACHGVALLFGVLGGSPNTGHAVPVGMWPYWWAGLINFTGGGLVLVGLLTRPAALLCSGTMAYAYFSVHLPAGLWPTQNGGEPATLYCWAFLAIAVVGAGPWSIDALLGQGTARPLAPGSLGRWRGKGASEPI